MKRVALIGVGKMGLSHLAIANSLPDCEVVALCDTSKILLTVLSRGLKANTYTDYQTMLVKEQIDAVIISVPNAFHYQVVKDCLNAGLHTFIEKPFTLSPETSEELVALASEKSLSLQVGYVNRFCDSFQYVRKFIETQAFGAVNNYKALMNGPVITEEHTSGWRNDYKKGGGCLNDYGPHCIDLVCFLFGTNFEVITAKLESVFSSSVDDIVCANLEHDDHTKGELNINWSDNSVRKATNRVIIECEFATITVSKQEVDIECSKDFPELNMQTGLNKKYITDFNTDVSYYLRGEEFSRQLATFIATIHGEKNDICDVHAAYKVDKTIYDIFAICGVNQNG